MPSTQPKPAAAGPFKAVVMENIDPTPEKSETCSDRLDDLLGYAQAQLGQ
jgi:hypothetical protein